jgi:Na+/H+-dicarboxylate symporter
MAAGLVLNGDATGSAARIPEIAAAVVRAWTNAFRLVVAPLIVAQLFRTVAGSDRTTGATGRIGAAALMVFSGLLVVTAVITVVVTPPLLALPWIQSIHLGPAVPIAAAVVSPASTGPGAWVDALIPPSLFSVAASDNILTLMVIAILFGLAARRLGPAERTALTRAASAVGDTLFVIVDWLLFLTPVVLFALGLDTASRTGLAIGQAMLVFSAVEIVVLVIAIVALYPIGGLLGSVRIGTLARALWPAQIAAATTRSSLATVPTLLAEARSTIGLPEATSAFVLPLAGATLKLSRAVSGPVKLLFLAVVLGIPLGLTQVVVFTATMLLLSPTTLGVPRVMSTNRSLPAYVAAGIPPEYVVLLGATTALTDVFLTLINTTGYLVAAVLVSRAVGGRTAAMPTPGSAPSPTEPAMEKAPSIALSSH